MEPELTLREAVLALQSLLIARATGGAASPTDYDELRARLLSEPLVAGRLPTYVRTCRNLDQFWAHIRQIGGYVDRRNQIWGDFGPLMDSLDSRAPNDTAVVAALSVDSLEGVRAEWQRALDRRVSDPEGAITAARSLLESTCKHILHARGQSFDERDDLPKLYRRTAKELGLAPDQHTEDVFKQILGGCFAVVEGLGSLRNRLGDAHGKAPKAARPSSRHSELAVNLAGAMAVFLVDTLSIRTSEV